MLNELHVASNISMIEKKSFFGLQVSALKRGTHKLSLIFTGLYSTLVRTIAAVYF